MSKLSRKLRIGAALAALLPLNAAQAAETSDQTAIRLQLQRYETALNASDVNTVMTLYTEDAVFMPQHSLPAVGKAAVRTAYDNVFKTIKLAIRFDVDEVKVLAGDWAFARTRSNGTVKVLATELPPAPEANQELFLLHKEPSGQWLFARYIFSTTNPPAKGR
jgi:uncharacterized protein (TIGR02246 family)